MMQNNPLYMEHYEPQRRLVIDPALKIAVCIQAKGAPLFLTTKHVLLTDIRYDCVPK